MTSYFATIVTFRLPLRRRGTRSRGGDLRCCQHRALGVLVDQAHCSGFDAVLDFGQDRGEAVEERAEEARPLGA